MRLRSEGIPMSRQLTAAACHPKNFLLYPPPRPSKTHRQKFKDMSRILSADDLNDFITPVSIFSIVANILCRVKHV